MKKQVIRLFTAIVMAVFFCLTAVAAPKTLIPGGNTVGMKLYSQGLVITGFEKESAARKAGLRKGDVIIQVDGVTVQNAAFLREAVNESQVTVTVLRRGKRAEFRVVPRQTQSGRKLGAYIRDSIAGIGTVTYYDPDTGSFGALGHGVSDLDAQMLLPVEKGLVVFSTVMDVEKGKCGKPGELKGKFDVQKTLGEIRKNTQQGIFGRLDVPIPGKPLPVAQAQEVHPGTASILSNINGTQVQSYSVELVKIYPNTEKTDRNMLLKITDRRLLNQTGGIVQGMSGSPILQDGKLVGAVTHVLVNDPTKGYGIFLENMLAAAG